MIEEFPGLVKVTVKEFVQPEDKCYNWRDASSSYTLIILKS